MREHAASGGASPALISIAGQYTACRRRMSLPIEVVVGGPVAVEALAVAAVPDRGAVVDERVEPHVRDVRGVPRQRDAPRDRGAADREVAQPLLDDPEHLAALPGRLDRLGMLGVVGEEAVLESRELEEVVLLGDPLDRACRGSGSSRRRARPRRSTARTRRSRGPRRCRARCRRRRRRAGGTRSPPGSGGARWCG